ncbi:MAG: cysteine--tRNA ligase [Dehalococcoidales bacterium]|nr:cysteine--tRNA ligase [Dehalococcoidales bacterium]
MKVFNTLSGKKEDFSPQGDEVKMYVCGVTPYADAHLGHAMSYIIFDVIRRYLRYRGYKVKYVQNVTDIDDKIIDRANKLGIPQRELAEKFTRSYFEDMKALNIAEPDVTPYATDEIPKIIEIVRGLIDKGYGYESQGSVYFRVRNVPDYGKLSHRNLDSMKAGIRVESGEEKEDPLDFVLWKASKPGEPSWDSPWGPGRPGWHIECSAMSLKYLGNTLDIHGGGQDLVFPHHENEIAQSESFTGVKPFVRHWLHNGMVQMGGEKMSKSLGNLITIKQALEKYSADAIRIFVLSSHYRSPLTYSEEILEAAEKGTERLRQTVNNPVSGNKTGKRIDTEQYRERFSEAMDDDFNTAQAVATLFDLVREINKYESEGASAGEAREALKELGEVLGLTFQEREEAPLDAEALAQNSAIVYQTLGLPTTPVATDAGDIIQSIQNLVDLRRKLRKDKKWAEADMVRDKLADSGIILTDTSTDTVWRRKR